MIKLIAIGALITICAITWQIGASLSHEAVGMALGVIVGMMAGIPAALIGLSASPRVTNNTVNVTAQASVERAAERLPERFQVVGQRQQLQAVIMKRLEVKG